MSFNTLKQSATRERGTVMVLVIGVLAMLFIIGSSLLIVSRFERSRAKTSAASRDLDAVGTSLVDPLIYEIRMDLVGLDDKPYNSGWNEDDVFPGGDSADYAGFLDDGQVRNGDLVCSSSEPYKVGEQWKLWAVSGGSDTVGGNGVGKSIDVVVTSGPDNDADGDGLRDTKNSPFVSNLAAMYGGGYAMDIRVLSHGGMVLLHPMTHWSLLAQVIHPRDVKQGIADYSTVMSSELANAARRLRTVAIDPSVDEARLRRRGWLPPQLSEPDWDSGQNYEHVAPSMVIAFPITTGYADPSDPSGWLTEPVNHWWPFSGDEWKEMLEPGKALTDSGYHASDDHYDRVHLITTKNSDDIGRRQRGERRLLERPDGGGGWIENKILGDFYYLINPQATSGLDGYGIQTQPKHAYGLVGNALPFNGPAFRTQFSLRDVLMPVWDVGNGAYVPDPFRRVRQLTAYFLAMIQHTSVPGSNAENPTDDELLEQLRTAAQLAVNTIDFADADSEPTVYSCTVGSPSVTITVVGVEKQPYITEAYAKIVQEAKPPAVEGDPLTWETTPAANKCVYAVELYNPYDGAFDLDGYELWVIGANDSAFETWRKAPTANPGFAKKQILLNGQEIPARNYLVIANTDTLSKLGITSPEPPEDGVFVYDDDLVTGNGGDDLELETGDEVLLVRRGVRDIETGDVDSNQVVVIDWLRRLPDAEFGLDLVSNMQQQELAALAYSEGTPYLDGDFFNGVRRPADLTDVLVRDTGLQRHKEPAVDVPTFWHFTLSRQMVMPLRVKVPDQDPGSGAWGLKWTEYGVKESATAGEPLGVPGLYLPDHDLGAGEVRLPQHSLFWTVDKRNDRTNHFHNQLLVEEEFVGEPHSFLITHGGYPNWPNDPHEQDVFQSRGAVAGFPVVTADRGVDGNEGGTLSFPTTGTLLLISRYGHGERRIVPDSGVPTILMTPLTVSAMEPVYVDNLAALRPAEEQIRVFDNGHMPILDREQLCTDSVKTDGVAQGRLGVPWGQLVFDYFSALPLEELAVMDVDGEDFEEAYAELFPELPFVEPEENSSVPFGPRVLGRVNINFAPWWVLDGLPVLADSYDGDSAWAAYSLPVPELESAVLDRPEALDEDDADMLPGRRMANLLTEELTLRNGTLPNMSPEFARNIVAYRERRSVDGVEPADNNNHGIGFASIGELCDLMSRVRLEHPSKSYPVAGDPPTLAELRSLELEASGEKPFSFINYLHWVAPVVRLKDWATVKNHAYTIYATIRTQGGEPAISVRTQVTVDRTRCLYEPSELPVRVTETEPIGYYNAVDD